MRHHELEAKIVKLRIQQLTWNEIGRRLGRRVTGDRVREIYTKYRTREVIKLRKLGIGFREIGRKLTLLFTYDRIQQIYMEGVKK